MADDRESEELYVVLMNHEEQYSLWPQDKAIPVGWRKVRESAPKSECLMYVDDVWKDITPLSLRLRTSARA